MPEVTLATSDGSLVIVNDRLLISAKILQKEILLDGKVIEPKSVSLSQFQRNPIVTRGVNLTAPRVGSCDSIVLSSDGTALIAKIVFDATELGLNAFQWFRSGLLWSFALKLDYQKSQSRLIALGIDRFAPII